jgi:hypothetical protein
MGTMPIFPGVKRPGGGADHSPLSITGVQYGWSYTSVSTLCLLECNGSVVTLNMTYRVPSYSSQISSLLIILEVKKGFLLQAWSGSWGSRRLRLLDRLDFRHYESGKVICFTHRPPSPPGVFLVLIFRGWVNPRAHGSVGIFGKKFPVTPLGIDSETFRLAAQCLNHYATPGQSC